MHISDLTIRLLQNVSNVIKNRRGLILNNLYGFMLFFQLVPTKATRFSKFVTGGGVGMILMSSAVVVVFAGRFTSKDRTR